jgi:cytosine/adenosine deaminase-related metal-dependent hydrolase
MAARGMTAVLNRKATTGWAPGSRAREMQRRGVRLALGRRLTPTTIWCCRTMRAVAGASLARADSRWITTGDVLNMATAGGAGAMREDKLGRIAGLCCRSRGVPARLAMVSAGQRRVRQMVFAETGATSKPSWWTAVSLKTCRRGRDAAQ